MITKTFNPKRFYKELGRLLYAAAMIHKKEEDESVIKINDFVSNELASKCNTYDSSGMNHAFYTMFEFNDCVNSNLDILEAQNTFMKFLSENIDLIDVSLIESTIRGIKKIESNCKNLSQSEKEIINKMKIEINEIAKFKLKSNEEMLPTEE